MKIFAIGMNYAAHNQELHGTVKRPDEPVIFTKADSAILNQGKPFFIPDQWGRIDYEAEVVVFGFLFLFLIFSNLFLFLPSIPAFSL